MHLEALQGPLRRERAEVLDQLLRVHRVRVDNHALDVLRRHGQESSSEQRAPQTESQAAMPGIFMLGSQGPEQSA